MYIFSTRKILATAVTLLTLTASAKTSENFNSRKGVPLKEVRHELQNSCWTFHHFDVNLNGWDPAIEGDGGMVSGTSALSSGNAGIYTPLLSVASTLHVSFHYRFSENFVSDHSRWIKLCLADANNDIKQVLEQINVNGSNAYMVSTYSTEFKNISSGEYRLLILYGGTGGSARIAIDELTTSAPYSYQNGCYSAPPTSAIQLRGAADRSAKGRLLSENSGEKKLFLVRNSADGNVKILPDGTYAFEPHSGFRGRNTSFVYRVCNSNGNSLCSDPVTARISFPTGQLTAFNGSYRSNGNVQLAWHTAQNNSIRSFVLERSTDGRNWHKAAEVVSRPTASDYHEYSYIDHVGKNKVLKKDIYYRLKHTDSIGATSISKTMIVRVYNSSSLIMISVAPHPEKKEITLNVQLEENSMVTYRVFDLSQNMLLHETVDAAAGINNIVIENSRNLTPGNYILEVVVNSKERMLVKLVKE
jgi:hypothetical protein